jgi:hypothetical protein
MSGTMLFNPPNQNAIAIQVDNALSNDEMDTAERLLKSAKPCLDMAEVSWLMEKHPTKSTHKVLVDTFETAFFDDFHTYLRHWCRVLNELKKRPVNIEESRRYNDMFEAGKDVELRPVPGFVVCVKPRRSHITIRIDGGMEIKEVFRGCYFIPGGQECSGISMYVLFATMARLEKDTALYRLLDNGSSWVIGSKGQYT